MQNRNAADEEQEPLRRQPLTERITPFVQRQEEETTEQEEIQAMHLQRQVEKQEPGQTKLAQKLEEEPLVQAKSAVQSALMLNPSTQQRLSETKGQGSPLPAPIRAFMEAGFGIELGHVRIHTGGSAVELSKALHAQAFTNGSDIYFNQGKFNPLNTDNQKLLAHELTHVVQQSKSNGMPLKPAERKQVGENSLIPADSVSEFLSPAPSTAASSKAAESSSTTSEIPDSGLPEKPPSGASEPTVAGSEEAHESVEATGQEQAPTEAIKAPVKPEEDPDFQQAEKSIRADARKQKRDGPVPKKVSVAKKVSEMRAAAALDEKAQREQSGQELQAAALEEAAKPKKRFNRVSFKNELKKKIEEKLPKTESQAKAFPSSGKLDEAKSEFGDSISEEKRQVTGPLETVAQMPAPLGPVTKLATQVPAARPAGKPSKIPPQLAAPKPRTDSEISLQHKSDELDQRMLRENITERQLAESEEPRFVLALKKKQDAQREIAAAPARYRLQEEQVLAQARQQTDSHARRDLQRMAAVKNKALGDTGVRGSQTQKESQTETRQQEIKNKIDDIYSRTEKDVNVRLDTLAIAIQNKFNIEAQMANLFFNMSVRRRLDDHYGWFTFDDKLAEWAGLSDGVAHIFLEEKQHFLGKMDSVLDDIATTVETELNQALDRIQQGRTELENFKKTLSKDEQVFADDLIKEVEDKFSDLEAAVEERQDELLETLSDLYVENVNKLQEEFDQINEELGSSWIEDAINFIGDVANAIRRLGALLKSIVDRIAGQVDAILAAPKKFFANLVSGIKRGIDTFTDNIGTYLEQGFWMWLTGAASARNIQIPDKMDAEGMFKLALQMLGIDKAFFLERIRVKLGKGVEQLLTSALAAKEKLLEPVRILLDGGIGALWQWIKDEVSARLSEIFTKIKEDIFEAIIKKALAWVASLFVPGLGFIRLIQAIYKALRWLVDNITRIEDLVNSFLDSIALAVRGNVDGIVKKVIKGLTQGVVIAIDFLAKLVGLGNFADKLQRAIQALRKPIQKVVDGLLTKARPIVRKLKRAAQKLTKGVKKAGGAVKAGVKRLVKWWQSKITFTLPDGNRHLIFLRGDENKQTLAIRSEEMTYAKFLEIQNQGANASKQAAINKALTIAEKIDQIKNESIKDPVPEKENKNAQEKANKIQAELVNLRKETIDIFGADIPDSTQPQTVETYLGMGKKMEVEPLTYNIKIAGTEPTPDAHPVYDNINRRKNSAGSDASFYIRGHLLNQQLGGQGQWNNMTPLSRSGNTLHERRVESLVKKAVASGAIVKYTVIVNYAPRSDKDTLKNQIETHESTVANIPIKHSIVDAEDNVPESLNCEATIRKKVDSKKYVFERSLVKETVQNDIKRSHTEYHLSGSPAPPRVNLNARQFQEYLPLKKYGLTSAMAMVIVANLQKREQAYGKYTVFKFDNKQIPEGVHDKLQHAPTSEVFLGKLGDRANKYPNP